MAGKHQTALALWQIAAHAGGERGPLDQTGDFLVVNNVGWNTGFATDDNDVLVLDKAGDIVMEASGSKLSVADRILDATVARG